MNDIDLSHLLSDVSVPSDGAARARKTATRRRHRRQVAGGGLAALLVIGTGVGILAQTSGPPDVLLQRETGHTVPETSTTTAPPDPRLRYIGLEHTSAGAGLPVTVSIKVAGGVQSDSAGPPKRGDFVLNWVRDEIGDMVWLETITQYDARSYTETSKVAAVFDVPRLADSENACLGSCVRKTTQKVDSSLVAVFRDTTLLRAWKVDNAKLSFTPTTLKDIAAYETTQEEAAPEPPNPPRPELYAVVAKCKPDDCLWYRVNEKVFGNGGSAPAPDFRISILRDDKLNKSVFVWMNESIVYDTLAVDDSEGPLVPTGAGYKYKGEEVPTLVLLMDGTNIKKAWLMDTSTHKFKSVPASDITAP